jgi:hypothetical protein
MMAVALAVIGTWLPASTVRFAAAFVLLWGVPAAAWSWALPGAWDARIARGTGLAFVASGLATLLLHLWPGPFPAGAARAVYAGLALVPVFAPRVDSEHRADISRRAIYALVAVVLVAALFRLVNLSYSEFQGDEAVIMSRAAQALAGEDRELFLHQKGPVEILTPMALWALTGTVTEWQARLPFSLAGVLAVLSVAALAARWFEDRRVGVLAGLLVAINGFLVAFGRIVQYQNIVVAMGALSLLTLTDYSDRGRARDLMLSALFAAYGLLAHYDAVLIGPAALWLLGGAFWSRRAQWRRELRHLVLALLVGVIVLGLFYVPFVRDPMFARTFAYLSGGRLGGDGVFHNSLTPVWRMSTFYNALAYVVGLALLIGLGALLGVRDVAAWLYFLTPLGFYLFVVVDPRTHVYTFYPGAGMLAGAAAVNGWRWLRARHRMLARIGVGVWAAWYLLCAGYIAMAFVSHQPEYKREWPASRHPLYPVPFADDELPPYGHFGFPYRAGWKAVAQLFAEGALEGTYASNEEPEITMWYVRDGARTMCGQPDTYIVAENVQDEIAIDRAELERAYALAARITVAGEPKIAIYKPAPGPSEVLMVAAASAVSSFDAGTTVAAQLPDAYSGAHPVGVDFGGVGRLLGYDLSSATVRRGDALRVTLFWEALSAPTFNHQVFVHLTAEGELAAQHDGAPACGFAPTALWEPGDLVRDEHVIAIGDDVPLGRAELTVGMYDLLTLARLPVAGSAENVATLTEIEVLPRAGDTP